MVFVYGGCEGNANNFYTKPACKIVCMQHNRSKVILIYSGNYINGYNKDAFFSVKKTEGNSLLHKQFLLWDKPLKKVMGWH